MQSPAKIVLIAIAAFPVVLATIHTECYHYFMKKDHCVWAAADTRQRCTPQSGKPPNTRVSKFEPPQHHTNQKTLQRRYTTDHTDTSFEIDGGKGICGRYDTNQPGACLWVGSRPFDGSNASTAGWLNGAKTSNCGKQLYIEREDNHTTVVYVPLVDGCRFYTKKPSVGCFQIAVTNKTFYDLKPTKKEIDQGYFDGLIWDFNDEKGDKLANAPV
ncbi:hypothetical protein CROQUDRAFT_662181 [Cronartium quercuum f. sp. fusiforme G11]|uniref:Secreted protein n=1 Tax=Cronartium quercuum f. sp. fusiforme G11 TaxID=708437 RepID=A0A9P6NAR1_9BASI|nr:hypothetical protein CROQUDRAFT_662181 [Cronartium quercuum f. sp. fusiforme G11]